MNTRNDFQKAAEIVRWYYMAGMHGNASDRKAAESVQQAFVYFFRDHPNFDATSFACACQKGAK